MGWSEIASFALIVSLMVMSPGPNGVLIARTVPTSGRLAGFANVAGFVTGFYLHGIFSILGISVILLQSATAFAIVKFLGAAYLCWLGVKALYAAFQGAEVSANVAPAKRRRSLVRAYIEGCLTNSLNPKVSMFYLAAFPQFLSVEQASFGSSLMLVTLHSAISALWFCAMILLLNRLTFAAKRGQLQRWLKGVTGLVFIGFGAKLATYRLNV